MPVRIYDISKKLGLENKEVLSKAKELGIAAARVASSSLDKITAEYLEQQLIQLHPELAAPPPRPAEAVAPAAPPPPEAPAIQMQSATTMTVTATALLEAETAPAEPPASQARLESLVPPTTFSEPPPLAEAPPPVKSPPPPTPALPLGPKVGDKVGFIQLPTKPGPKVPEKVPQARLPARPTEPRRTEFNKRGDIRSFRGAPAPGGPGVTGAKFPSSQKAGGKGAESTPAPAKITLPPDAQVITIKPPIVVRELAEQLKQKPFKIIGDLIEVGVFASVNQAIDETVAQKVCAKYGYRFEVEKRERGSGLVHAPVKKLELDVEDKPETLAPRPPVVTIMGHVDHGKTTLLDVIRKSNVAEGEAGGITQHIGAYTISFPHPERKNELAQITFLDTPGHAAFSSMRARGANVTDLVVLVVAANDGVMPQTIEALNHARAAKVPILVAVNKIDHPNANSLKVRQQLQDKGLVPDDWGGDTIFVEVSALTKQGVDKLIEMVLLQADLLELKANPNRRAKGNVIESGLEPGGPTATVLVRKGTLRVGDIIICGQYYGRVRALINEEGKRLKEAAPSVAVKVLGLNGVPEAGLEFSVVEDEKAARDLAEQRAMEAKAQGQETPRAKVTLENLFAQLESSTSKVLKVVVKADTQGSVEAIVEALKKIDSEKVSLEIIHSAVGTITESDVALASASDAVILGFHTRVDSGVADKAKHEGVQIKLYAIIYELIDQVKEGMAGLLEPLIKDVTVGAAEVRKIFELSKGTPVAGCMVTSGRIVKGKVRVRRRKEIIYEGLTQSLRRFQDEVNEVRAGMECGIRIEGFSEYQMGDNIECYALEKVAQKL
ncbi:MAG TPA: translation initiation factor IF-2 [Candidatus Binatia bacterium]|jgi:translation initiation factor IF-2|nr:translation initiation factor IF-2 [Candidatus Binatia bacterium]